jgi:hypothetical protein
MGFADRTVLAVLGWTLLCALPLPGQQLHRMTMDVGAGPSVADFGGFDEESRVTGTGLAVGGRFSYPVSRQLILEAGLTYFHGAVAERSLFPEFSIQLAFPFEAWWPDIGIGGGFQQILEEGGGNNGTVHGAAGVRRRLSRHWGVRAEVRGRVIVPTSFMADFTFGGGWTF